MTTLVSLDLVNIFGARFLWSKSLVYVIIYGFYGFKDSKVLSRL